MSKFMLRDSDFVCPHFMYSIFGCYCNVRGGGKEPCDGLSDECRVRSRALRRSKRRLKLAQERQSLMQRARGIAPSVTTRIEPTIGSPDNLIPHCPRSKSDETTMEREVKRKELENRRLAGLSAETMVVDEIGKVMQDKSEGEGASWGTSQQVTDGDSTSATASETSAQTDDATGER